MPSTTTKIGSPLERAAGTLLRLLAALALLVAGLAAPAAVTVATATPAVALDNGLAQTPPMGFNDWNAFGCDVDQQLIEQTADFFVSSGLKDAGYEYVNIDDCWMTHQRDPVTGRLVPDPVKFPDGIAATADYVHARGLKLGIYEDAGTATCAGYPGSLGHEQVDAQTFADWGVDYLKYDNCNNAGSTTKQQYIDRYSAMRDALAATGRPIVYSICEWGVNDPATWAGDVGNLWRTTGDISDNWSSMLSIVKQNAPLAYAAHPGAWNDPDMLEIGNGGMTDTEYRSHFSLWAVMAAPLLIGTDLRRATPETMAIYLNKDVIAVDQDPLGKQGVQLVDDGGHHVFAKPLADGDVAVALFNETDRAAAIGTTARAVGLDRRPAYVLKDLWSGRTTETAGRIAATVPAHGTVMYRVTGDTDWSTTEPSTSVLPDLEASYPGGPSVVRPGTPTEVTTTFANDGKVPVTEVRTTLTVPDGWTASPASPTTTNAVGSGRTFVTRWQVTAPAGTDAGSYPVSASTSYTWDEGSRPASSTGTTSALVVTPLPAGTTQLGDDDWTSASNGWGPVERNTSNGEQPAGDGHLMTVQGATFQHGLGVHAASEVDYYAGGGCSTLSATVGLDDEAGEHGNQVVFQVWADGAKVAEHTSSSADAAAPVTADVSGADFVRLVVTEGSDGKNFDHADWADATVTC
jgi:alpha-galactosidase